jgi:LAS superfamily LD-carboxypeptidase LdcB
LPGTSRHHWGTDLDVFDGAVTEPGYQVQLTVDECQSKFAKLHSWLDRNLSRFGFFRPYAQDLGGIAPEPWHISYLPVSRAYMEAYSYSALEQLLRSTELALKDQVLENLPQIYERYFLRISSPKV